MTRKYELLHFVAGFFGLLCLGVLVASNIHEMHLRIGHYMDPQIWAIVTVTFGTAVALAVVTDAYRSRRFLIMAGVAIAFVCGALYEITTTLDRVATTNDSYIAKKLETNTAYLVLADELRLAKNNLDFEAGNVRCGDKCNHWKAKIETVKAEMQAIRNSSDSLATRVAGISGGLLTVELVAIIQPFLLPLALFFFGNFLVEYGVSGRLVKNEFQVALTGRAAMEDNVLKFAKAFVANNKRKPTATEVVNGLAANGLTIKYSLASSSLKKF